MEILKRTQLCSLCITMESDLQQQPQVNSSGLTRYRSAPSTYFNNIIDREFYEHIFNRPSSPETERVFSRFMNSIGDGDGDGVGGGGDATAAEDSLTQNFSPDSAVKEEIINQQDQQVMSSMNNETLVWKEEEQQQHSNINNYSSASTHNFYQSSSRPPLPNQNLNSGMEGTYSVGVNRLQQMKKTGTGNHSNLIRHSSSPAGLFSQINIENGMFYFLFINFFYYYLCLKEIGYRYFS